MSEFIWQGDNESGGGGGGGSPYFLDPVATFADLPGSAPDDALVLVVDENTLYRFVNPSWQVFVDPDALQSQIDALDTRLDTAENDINDLQADKQDISEKGQPNGYASLGSDGKIPTSELPAIAITDTFVVASQAAMLALTAEVGDVAIRTDVNESYILQAEPASTLGNWIELQVTDANKVSKTGDLMSGELTISLDQGGGASTIEVFDSLLHKRDTGVLSGGAISINADPSKFDISAGEGNIMDVSDVTYPLFTKVTWSAKTAQTVTNIGTQPLTYVAINPDGSVHQQGAAPTMQERRQKIWLGRIGHSNGVSIGAVVNNPEVITATGNQLRDLMDAVGLFNRSGNVVSHNGANLQLSKTAGAIFVAGGNFQTNPENPNVVTTGALAPISFGLFKRDGIVATAQTAIIPSNYDNAGTVTTIPGSANQATNFRVYQTASNNILVLYGQTIYPTLSAAIAGIKSEAPVIPSTIQEVGLLIGVVSVTKGATALNDPAQAAFSGASKFGEASASGQSVSTLQQAYSNGANGNITLDTTRGAVKVSDASTPIGADLFSVNNNAGSTKYFSVTSGGIRSSAVAATRLVKANGSGDFVSGSVQLNNTNDVTGTLGVSNGGTGRTDKVELGEKNYIRQPNNSNAWTQVGTGVDVAEVSNADPIPDNATQSSGTRITRNSGTTDYLRTRFTLDRVDYNKKLKIQYDQAFAGTTGDFTIQVWSNTASDYSGTSTQLSVSADANVPGNFTGVVQKTFDSPNASAPYLEVRIVAAAGTTPLYLNNFLVGPGVIGQVPAIGNPLNFTPVSPNSSFGTIGTSFVQYRQDTAFMKMAGRIRVGTPAAAEARLNIPFGTIGNFGGSSTAVIVGKWTNNTATAATVKQGVVWATPGLTYLTFGVEDTGSATNPTTFLNASAIVATGGDLYFDGELSIPIAEWAGSGVNLGAGAQQEFVSNSNTADADNTSAFVSGPSTLPGILTNARLKRIQLSTPLQNGESLIVEVAPTINGPWTDAMVENDLGGVQVSAYGAVANNGFGQIRPVSGSNTQFDIVFRRYRSGTSDWATTNGFWRARRFNPSSPVGFGLATATDSGLAPAGVFGGDIGVIELQQKTTNPAAPTTSNEVKIYTKGTLLIAQFNDAGTTRYKYLDMAGTGVTWVHTTTPP